ncbi:MAG: cytochrome c oxidase assembly protein [Ginsengibacter sp.]
MQSIFSYWSFNPFDITFILLIWFLYLYAISFRLKKQSFYFFSSLVLIILCVTSPLNYLGENFLFSVHMLLHVLLLLIAAPLLVASIPAENKFKKFFLFISKRIYKAPLISWLTGVVIMWVWHVPVIFNKMVSMHGMQTSSLSMTFFMNMHLISLLIAGSLFCWPVINPYKEYRIGSLTSILYLSSACVFCSLLGLLITFAPAGTYTGYVMNNDVNGFSSIIRNQLNISTATDQQIGGLIMWVPCCFIYLSASMIILIKWFQKKDVKPIRPDGYHELSGYPGSLN